MGFSSITLPKIPAFFSWIFSSSPTPLQQANLKDIFSRMKAYESNMGKVSLSEKIKAAQELDSIISKWQGSKTVPDIIRTAEKTALAFRMRFPLGMLDNPTRISQLQADVKKHDGANYHRWLKNKQDEALFFSNPQFVDFVFATHLHKSLTYFEQKIPTQNGEPGLIVQGKFTSWTELSKRFTVENGKIYSMESGEKKRWIYVQSGLECHDPYNWSVPIPLKTLKEKPGRFLFQVVTSHVKEENQVITDVVLRRARHTWFRLITPEGEVYSFGRRYNPDEFNILQPLASVKARISCPDIAEASAEERMETTFPISSEKAENVMQLVMKYAADENSQFNFVTCNCAAFTQEIMRASGIGEIPKTEITPSRFLYKLFVPKMFRKILKTIWKYTGSIVLPAFVKKTASSALNFITSLLFFPIATMLGGWFNKPRVETPAVPKQDNPSVVARLLQKTMLAAEKRFIERAKKYQWDTRANSYLQPHVRRLYNHMGDVLNPSNLNMHMPALVAKWQKKQGANTRVY